MEMNPDSVQLDNIAKLFEYEKISRDIDSIGDIDALKTFCKCYVKLYFKQQEVVSNLVGKV